MFESLLINHAFIDGNKRVAFFATDVFLRLNGWKLVLTADEGEQFIVGMLEANDCSFEKILPGFANTSSKSNGASQMEKGPRKGTPLFIWRARRD